jgi:hypothetical protein
MKATTAGNAAGNAAGNTGKAVRRASMIGSFRNGFLVSRYRRFQDKATASRRAGATHRAV